MRYREFPPPLALAPLVECLWEVEARDEANRVVPAPDSVLFVEGRSLDAARKGAMGAKVLVEERTTFYGMRETVVLEPGGTVVIFAEPL